jgi:NUMOD4 motif/HNH endonuclease
MSADVIDLETWRDVVTMPGIYEVSNLGRVRACPRLDSSGRRRPGGLLKPWVNGDGYRHITLSLDGRQRTVKVAKLVAMSFCGHRPSLDHDVLHNDGNKLNDRAANLRWGTARENAADAAQHGVIKRGERHWKAKLTAADVAMIRQDRRPSRQVARAHGIADRTVRDIRDCRSWQHLPPCQELAAAA